jgi:site-specific recombinase XerD
MQILLSNGCSRSEIKVTPSNWKTKRASTRKPWVIHYRFYDGAEVKAIQIRGMNEFVELEHRRIVTKRLINQEIHLLDTLGWNPIKQVYMAPQIRNKEVSEYTPFIEALKWAKDQVDVVPKTRIDINSIVNAIDKCTEELYDYDHSCKIKELVISQIKRKHLKSILDYQARNNPRWSNNRYNKYKAYISMLFKELLEVEAVDSNPARDLSSKKKSIKLKAVLSTTEEKLIDETLQNKHYNFWRFVRIFYDSQARITELLVLKKDARVNIKKQEFIVTVKKGSVVKEDIRVIGKSVIDLWQEVWDEAKYGEYLFSKFLKPGPKKIRPDQITMRWRKYVKSEKTGLGIKKDFYSLKHLSTDRMSESYGLQVASAGAGHTNLGTTQIYAVNEKRRKLEVLKQKNIAFGSSE